MLTVQNVDLFYGAAQAVRSVSLSASIGKVTCLLGRNGVGKTSLLRAICGLQPISAGSMRFDNPSEQRRNLSPRRTARTPMSISTSSW